MSLRAFRLRVLPIVAVLSFGALLLASCDSGADFSSLDDLSSDSAPVAKVRAWYEEQAQATVSEGLAKTSGDLDSLTIAAFVQKFPPDWNKAVLLSRKDGGRAMVATLGQYTDEKYDTTLHHVRTIIVDLDSSGDVESGNIVIFSSSDELFRDGFDTYVRQYLAEDFGDMKMLVSRYTMGFEAVDALLYRPGQISLPVSLELATKQVVSGSLGKLASNSSIFNSISGVSGICDVSCYFHHFGWICAGDDEGDDCSRRYELVCTITYCEDSPGGGGGGGDDSGGGGGDGGDGGEEEEDENDCDCNDQEACDLADEYTSSDHGSWPCSKFKWIDPKYRVGAQGYESKHNGFGYVSSTMQGNVIEMGYLFGMTFRITSAYRCPVGNSRVSDASLSQHKYGTAADLNSPSSSDPRWTEDFKRRIAVSAVNDRGRVLKTV